MNSYTKVFGADSVRPSEIGYQALALTANVTLTWPIEAATTLPKVSRIMEVSASSPYVLSMPDATLVGPGESVLFVNRGLSVFSVADNSGASICSIAPGSAWYVYLADNSTVVGTWSVFQFGASIAAANAAALAGAGLVAISTTLNQSLPVTSLNTNYSLGAANRAAAIIWTGGAGTLTLPLASSVGANWFFHFRNDGSGTLNLDTQGGDLINGSATLAADYGDSAIVVTDGADFFTIGLSSAASGSFSFLAIDLAGLSGTYTLSGAEIDKISYRFTGALGGDISIVVPSTVQQYWIDNQATGHALDVGTAGQVTPVDVTSGQRAILYCDGTDVVDADTAGIATPIPVASGGTGSTTASGARTNLGGTATGIAVFTAATAAAARTAIVSPSVSEAMAAALLL